MPHNGIDTSTARLEGQTLGIRVPLHFQRHGGRKLIVGPDGEENWAPLPTGPDTTLIRSLGRAHRWKRLIENGTYGSIKELAAAEKVSALLPAWGPALRKRDIRPAWSCHVD